MRRLPQTLADYVVVAISPLLIMLLIGSLVFFLLEVFYQGEYQLRLQYVFALFVIATVLIGRISIEEGAAHASLFAGPMAVVTGLAMMRFVEFQADVSPGVHFLINLSLMGIVWFSAHMLTWDCTVVDESVDASGAGLLDRPGRATKHDAQPLPERTWLQWAVEWWNWLRTWIDRPKQSHTLGRWVVYFGAATLPLFGLGQMLIPATDVGSRRYIFLLLGLYLASALGLLLTTSFLSLRRYLRQRQLEMPVAMTGAWLATGAGLVLATLLVAAIVPRPAAEYEVARLPVMFGSPGQKNTSRFARGKDGVEDQKQPTSNVKPGNEQAEKTVSSDKGKADDPQAQDKSQEGSRENGDKQEDAKSAESPSSQKAKDAEAEPKPKPDASQPSNPSMTPPPPASRLPFHPMNLLPWLRWPLYALIIAAIGGLAWWYRQQIASAWRTFVAELIAAWRRLWLRYSTALEDDTSEPGAARLAIPRRFADYPDPFATGLAQRLDASALVQYSFAALEAWGNEHDCRHEQAQTPHEFALQIGRTAPRLGVEAQRLAEAYSFVAYGSGNLSQRAREQLRALWKLLGESSTP